jgi:hypothetical protein
MDRDLRIKTTVEALVARMETDRELDYCTDPASFIPVSAQQRRAARAIADIALRVALYPEARTDWVDQLDAALPAFLPFRGKVWQHALERIFAKPESYPLPASGVEAVPRLLEYLARIVEVLPVEFRKEGAHVHAAEELDRLLIDRKRRRWKIALNGGTPGGHRRLYTPWGAARIFARAWGLKMGEENAKKRVFAK